MEKIGIIGHFGYGKHLINGQTIKTNVITEELKKILGNNHVCTIDSSIGIKGVIPLFFRVGLMMYTCDNVIMLPAHNGLIFFSFVCYFWSLFFKARLHYIVIGSWLSEFIRTKKFLIYILKRYDCIYAETTILINDLKCKGFNNLVYFPNCKKLLINKEFTRKPVKPYKMCIFSRITKNKGITDAIDAIATVNMYYGENVYRLDIFGPIDDSYSVEFNKLINEYSEFIYYGGIIDYELAADVLKNYDYLLFPTRFKTEGIPGTIIDAYAAGLPVIFSKWQNYRDIMLDGKTGIGYKFCDINSLISILKDIIENKFDYEEMQKNCFEEARKYQSTSVIKILLQNL